MPKEVGYDLYVKEYQQAKRFRFRLFENRGHMYIFYTDAARAYALRYIDELELTLTEYGQTHVFDKAVGYELDGELFASILDFLNAEMGE